MEYNDPAIWAGNETCIQANKKTGCMPKTRSMNGSPEKQQRKTPVTNIYFASNLLTQVKLYIKWRPGSVQRNFVPLRKDCDKVAPHTVA